MSDNKRYYWLKLDENFFEDDTIQWLEEQKNGKDYVIFYLKLMLKSLKDDGTLIRYVGQRLIPYDVSTLAKITNTHEDTVAVAMKTFVEIGLVETKETGEIFMSQIAEMVGSETKAAQRMRRLRAREKETELIEEKTSERNNVQKSYEDVQNSDTEYRDTELESRVKDIELQQEQEEKLADDVADYKKAINFYQNNFGVINPHTSEDLKMWIEDIGIDLVIEALKRAIENQKNYAYAKGIMRNWANNNIKTMKDVEAQDVSFTNKKQGYKQSTNDELEEWDYQSEIYGENWQEEQKQLDN